MESWKLVIVMTCLGISQGQAAESLPAENDLVNNSDSVNRFDIFSDLIRNGISEDVLYTLTEDTWISISQSASKFNETLDRLRQHANN